MLLLSIAIVAIIGGFNIMLDANSRNEVRSAAVSAAEQVLEALRRVDPETLPTSGSSAAQQFQIDNRSYEVVTWYCRNAALCQTKSRHLEIEVAHDGQRIHTVETVFTKFE
jgi:hypothetical protein